MLCSLPGSIILAFFGYLLYQQYQLTADQNSGMVTNVINSMKNKKVSFAGASFVLVVLICSMIGFISSSLFTIIAIVSILTLDNRGYFSETA